MSLGINNRLDLAPLAALFKRGNFELGKTPGEPVPLGPAPHLDGDPWVELRGIVKGSGKDCQHIGQNCRLAESPLSAITENIRVSPVTLTCDRAIPI